MSLIKELPRVAARVLKNHRTIRPQMKEKFGLIEVAYGTAAVVQDFEKWCEELVEKGENPKYAIYDYLKIIDSRLGSSPVEQRPDTKDPKVAELSSLAYELTSLLPAVSAVAQLLVTYSFDEIKDAMTEFTENLTEADVKSSMKKFWSEGGAGAIILARRRRAERAK